MRHVQVVHTAGLDAQTLKAANALLHDAFEGDWTADDWDHARGGLHVLVWDADDLIGHGAVVLRRLLHGGRALRTGYVEGVGVRADRRGQGHGAALMTEVERIIRAGYELGALGASDDGARIYLARGWQCWRGPSFALTPTGIQRTADEDGNIYVLQASAPLDLDAELTCDWRDGEVW